MKYLMTVLGLALLGAIPAQAQQQAPQQVISNPLGLIQNFNPETIEPLITEVGLNVRRQTIGGSEAVIVSDARNWELVLQPTACGAAAGCLGLIMLAKPDIATQPTAQQVMQYNANNNFMTAVMDGGNVWLRDYLVANYGVTRGSFIVELTLLYGALEQWQPPAQQQ
ncbi:MAG: hypothetical protein CMK09_16825 [Ponticaulis sp.]|nr:hypothetical protein [Ponticaulis sp.]|tara:strand:- start:2943 stop:3443 length:501 start_codon:yes stop_codon:yes gene_type:complete